VDGSPEILTDPTNEIIGGSDGVDFLIDGASPFGRVPGRSRGSLGSRPRNSASGLEIGDNGEGGLFIAGAIFSSGNLE
jgi:hypothetical protein